MAGIGLTGNGGRVCKVCGTGLVNGEAETLETSSKDFTVKVENIPAQKCPKCHEGLYWLDKKFGPAFMDGLAASGIMAKSRRTLTLRFRHVCPTCGRELDSKRRTPREFTFEFTTGLAKTRPYRVTLTAPALFCSHCNRQFMPFDKGAIDIYYSELHDIIAAAIYRRFK
ncbi:MAG: YgiT-type zinc finger protein [Nitrospirae bacterium]|nr:YgiT-type zinc finger protein [Nitrospirota bacterium]